MSTLGICAALFVWHLVGTNSSSPIPLISPPAAPRDSNPPIANNFGTADNVPNELDAETFSRMIEEFSEPGGYFMYDNHLSNERSYQDPIPSLINLVKPGRVYLGVGPEQNFTYIAALRPAMAFIIDIRRQNMIELLMYKALFGMASNRAEFVSMLFSRKLSGAFDDRSLVDDLFGAAGKASPDEKLFKQNLSSMKAQLHLNAEDEQTMEDIYRVFFSVGPDLNYNSVNRYAPYGPSYANLMTLTDGRGENWSYLASEESFRFVKTMQRKNLIVPIVGDFSGPKAIRTVGKYLKDHRAAVSAFYVSNVEMYILASPQWKNYCANVADLPMDQSSMFIRFLIGQYARVAAGSFVARNMSVISPMIDVKTAMVKGYPPSYYDLIHASR
jgi:hypothetical protein